MVRHNLFSSFRGEKGERVASRAIRGHVAAAGVLVLAWLTTPGCGAPDESRTAQRETASVGAPPRSDTDLVQHRPDWDTVWGALPRDPSAAATVLERYRQAHGLPFQFFVRSGAPASMTNALHVEENEMGCGTLALAFVRRMPVDRPVFHMLRAIEFDSLGTTLREWPLPGEAGFFELVQGVAGDELVASYPDANTPIFLRIRTDGSYTVSAESPPPLPPEEWVEAAESTWVRVRPRDDGTFTVYGGATRESMGTWVPRGDSGWYVRSDSVPGQRSVARAVTRPWDPRPRLVRCPASAEYEGMVCRGFPGVNREHRIAYPMPCS
jgi:hypothetical protein